MKQDKLNIFIKAYTIIYGLISHLLVGLLIYTREVYMYFK